MKVLIVYAHSQPASFNGALLRTAVQTLEQEGHAVRVSDLYAMGFNPVASDADFKERASKVTFSTTANRSTRSRSAASATTSPPRSRRFSGATC